MPFLCLFQQDKESQLARISQKHIKNLPLFVHKFIRQREQALQYLLRQETLDKLKKSSSTSSFSLIITVDRLKQSYEKMKRIELSGNPNQAYEQAQLVSFTALDLADNLFILASREEQITCPVFLTFIMKLREIMEPYCQIIKDAEQQLQPDCVTIVHLIEAHPQAKIYGSYNHMYEVIANKYYPEINVTLLIDIWQLPRIGLHDNDTELRLFEIKTPFEPLMVVLIGALLLPQVLQNAYVAIFDLALPEEIPNTIFPHAKVHFFAWLQHRVYISTELLAFLSEQIFSLTLIKNLIAAVLQAATTCDQKINRDDLFFKAICYHFKLLPDELSIKLSERFAFYHQLFMLEICHEQIDSGKLLMCDSKRIQQLAEERNHFICLSVIPFDKLKTDEEIKSAYNKFLQDFIGRTRPDSHSQPRGFAARIVYYFGQIIAVVLRNITRIVDFVCRRSPKAEHRQPSNQSSPVPRWVRGDSLLSASKYIKQIDPKITADKHQLILRNNHLKDSIRPAVAAT